ESAYGKTPPALPSTISSTVLDCQRALDKAGDALARGWSSALGRCELGNASGRTVPPAVCSTDPDGLIARAQAKAGAQIDKCASFAGPGGCATTGSPAAVKACFDAAIGGVVGPYTEVA